MKYFLSFFVIPFTIAVVLTMFGLPPLAGGFLGALVGITLFNLSEVRA